MPAVEPGILPGGLGEEWGTHGRIRTLVPDGKKPPSTAAKMAAATHLLRTLIVRRKSGFAREHSAGDGINSQRTLRSSREAHEHTLASH